MKNTHDFILYKINLKTPLSQGEKKSAAWPGLELRAFHGICFSCSKIFVFLGHLATELPGHLRLIKSEP